MADWQGNATPTPPEKRADVKTCATGPCLLPRATGSAFCRKHGECRMPACHQPRVGDLDECMKHASVKDRAKLMNTARRSEMICPHCQIKGQVSTVEVTRKQGISGAKATGAVLTGGLSLLATGLSRKGKVTEARCGNCGVGWTIA